MNSMCGHRRKYSLEGMFVCMQFARLRKTWCQVVKNLLR